MWFEHLNQIAENRAKGAKKAAETRRKRKMNGNNAKTNSHPRKATKNTDDICLICEMHYPPLSESVEGNEDHLISWICCDGCTLWCHMICACIISNEVPSQWLCLNCNEVWYPSIWTKLVLYE